MNITERDRLIRECWVPVKFKTPDPLPAGKHFPVAVWGVVDDSRFTLAGQKTFMDVVHYWPAANKWTITHCARSDDEAEDFPVTVTHWQPLPPLPWL